jgi:HEAT repeat protein
MTHSGWPRTRIAGAVVALAGTLMLAGPAAGDAPQFQNARVQSQTLQGPLQDEFRRWTSASSKARWLGYAVPQVSGQHEICCSNYHGDSGGRCGNCTLESERSGVNIHWPGGAGSTVHLESSGELAVLFRAENGKLTKIRVFSLQCTVDAGGLDVLWLENLKSSDSVALLENFVRGGKSPSEDDRHDSASKSALMAIALHADASADSALESFISPDRPEWLRKETAFWLGEARGAEGLQKLQKMARSDPSTHVREQVAFALSVSDQSGALSEMIRMAHEDQSAQVRGQALFWLAQKAGKKAESTITGAIENDPDTDVKKKAVFALSQMPKEEGIPKLIEVAQTNRNPEVRKQAMFWLGQSDDPRALAFFEKILGP